jgi:stage IV sporulation protein FB
MKGKRVAGWSIEVGSPFGIKVRIHVSFLLLFLLVVPNLLDGDLEGAVFNMLFIIAVFSCVVIHELGHSLIAKRYGIDVGDITLLPIGGVARLQEIPREPGREVAMALAGPGVSIGVALTLFLFLLLLAGLESLGFEIPDIFYPPLKFISGLMWANFWLAAFNLFPAFPMDGGRIFRGILAMKVGRAKATYIAASVGQALSVVLMVSGFLWRNPFLFFIALFVFMGATMESAYEEAMERKIIEHRYSFNRRNHPIVKESDADRSSESKEDSPPSGPITPSP